MLTELDRYLNQARRGERQVVFITGESGIGKTALADEFQRRPLLLVLEDLHWADPSTVDFISAMARCRAPARLTSNWVGIGCAPSSICSSGRISPDGDLNLDKPRAFLSTPWSW